MEYQLGLYNSEPICFKYIVKNFLTLPQIIYFRLLKNAQYKPNKVIPLC